MSQGLFIVTNIFSARFLTAHQITSGQIDRSHGQFLGVAGLGVWSAEPMACSWWLVALGSGLYVTIIM